MIAPNPASEVFALHMIIKNKGIVHFPKTRQTKIFYISLMNISQLFNFSSENDRKSFNIFTLRLDQNGNR